MTLIMKTAKGAVSFEWCDADAETVVRIEPTDEDEVMIRKLKRVIALVEGEQWEPRLTARNLTPALPASMVPPVQTGNGWATMAPPEIPEGADYELIPPGEQG
mgnify:CR=1 FL=1